MLGVMSQEVGQVWGAIFGQSVRYAFWPVSDGDGTGSVQLATGVSVWGAWTDIIALNAIATEFWLCGLHTFTPNQIQVWQIQIGTAAGAALLFPVTLDITALTMNVNMTELPYPIWIAPNANIDGRAGGAGVTKTIEVQLLYAVAIW